MHVLTPNEITSADAGIALLLQAERPWPRAAEFCCSTITS
jgi:hypothetical protein